MHVDILPEPPVCADSQRDGPKEAVHQASPPASLNPENTFAYLQSLRLRGKRVDRLQSDILPPLIFSLHIRFGKSQIL